MSKVFFAWSFLHSFKYFNYIYYDPTFGGQITQIIDFIILISFLLNNKINRNWYTGDFILLFLSVPILSILPAYLNKGQPVLSSVQGVLDLTKILIYFYLYKFEIKERLVLNLLIAFVVIRFSITVLQQWYNSDFLFVGPGRARGEFGDEIELRGGVYRFLLDGEFISPLVFFYAIQKLLEKFRWKLFVILLISLGGIFLDQTRQTWSAIIVIFLFFVFPKLNFWSRVVLISLIFFSLAYDYGNLIFGDMSTNTVDEFNSDNVRWLAAYFFLFNYWNGNLTLILGNGLAHKSSYFREIVSLQEQDGLYRVDIGIIGYFNQYGIYGLIVLLTFFIYIYRKYWKLLDLYIKLYALYCVVILPTFVGLTGSGQYWLFMGVLFFLIDSSLNRNASAFELRK